MNLKEALKRAGKYILWGIPVTHVDVTVARVDRGNCLEGKRILITGGGRGLGFSIAERCAAEGAEVIIAGRRKETLETASDSLGGRIQTCVLDVADIEDTVKKLVSLFSEIGRIDCLVNNAGISYHEKDILDVSVDGFEEQFRTNLEGSYFLAKEFIRLNKTDCNIIFMSSERGMECDDIPYGLTKAALNSLTRGLARRFYQKRIRVNAIAPGVTASEMTGRKADENLYTDGLSSGRFFIPEEIAEIAVFLLSDASKCISGEIINCDAGNHLSSYY